MLIEYGTLNNKIDVSNKFKNINIIPKGDINRYNIIGIDPCPHIVKSIFIDGIEYNENKEINFKPLINILIRNCYRPEYFKKCINRILSQSYSNFNIIMCYDNDQCLEYLNTYIKHPKLNGKISLIKVKKNIMLDCFYNLYCNELLNQVKSGWIMFLDDDDILTTNDNLQIIVNNIINENDLIFWKFKAGKDVIYLTDVNNIRANGEIANSSYIFHSKFKDLSRWELSDIGDYLFIKKLSDKINFNRKFINQVLTKTIDNNEPRHGGKELN